MTANNTSFKPPRWRLVIGFIGVTTLILSLIIGFIPVPGTAGLIIQIVALLGLLAAPFMIGVGFWSLMQRWYTTVLLFAGLLFGSILAASSGTPLLSLIGSMLQFEIGLLLIPALAGLLFRYNAGLIVGGMVFLALTWTLTIEAARAGGGHVIVKQMLQEGGASLEALENGQPAPSPTVAILPVTQSLLCAAYTAFPIAAFSIIGHLCYTLAAEVGLIQTPRKKSLPAPSVPAQRRINAAAVLERLGQMRGHPDFSLDPFLHSYRYPGHNGNTTITGLGLNERYPEADVIAACINLTLDLEQTEYALDPASAALQSWVMGRLSAALPTFPPAEIQQITEEYLKALSVTTELIPEPSAS